MCPVRLPTSFLKASELVGLRSFLLLESRHSGRVYTKMAGGTRLLAGAMFGISACACIPEALRPAKFYPNAALDRRGGSSIIDPMGDYIAGPVYDVETIVYGDIDLSTIALSKSIHNLTGSYSRWDLFSLATRQKPYDPVVSIETLGQESSQERHVSNTDERIAALEKQIETLKEDLKRSQ